MKYSITRALAERKVLIKRHEKAVKELELIAVQRGNRLVGEHSHIKPEDITDRVKSSYQSILDLERRIDEIKFQIDKSNLVTVIKIGTKEMTIQEALVLKNLYRKAKSSYDESFEANRRIIEKTVADTISASKDGKTDTELEKNTANQINSLYEVKFVDPLSLETIIKQLETEIEEFESNVDYALSESNSQTFIEVAD